LGLAYRARTRARRKVSQGIVYEPRYESGKKKEKKDSEILLKAAGSSRASPTEAPAVARVRGDGQPGRWLSSADSPYSNTESWSYVSEEREREREGGEREREREREKERERGGKDRSREGASEGAKRKIER